MHRLEEVPTISSPEINPPPIHRFDRTQYGHFGEFGNGANIRAFYLQSSISAANLREISLLTEIPGAEKWSIRDLFQRDLDLDRVQWEIKPHFEDPEKIKFFSPLTLTLLPMVNGVVSDRMPRAIESEEQFNGQSWTCVSRGSYYRFRHQKDTPQWTYLEWNSSITKMVAIDGQHRLATMRSILEDGVRQRVADFNDWNIPVIIASFRAATSDDQAPTVLEVMRQLFSNINTEAKTVSEGRQILLNDIQPNSICTQELIERSHENDLKDTNERDNSIMPLLGFDWRLSTKDESADATASYNAGGIQSVIEIHEVFKNFVLGEDCDQDQVDYFEALLNIDTELLNEMLEHRHIPLNRAHELRREVRKHLVSGVGTVLERFTPYRDYITALREFEKELTSPSSESGIIYQHAFSERRYGRNDDLAVSREQIDEATIEIESRIPDLKKDHIPRLFERAIGTRGIFYAFGELAWGEILNTNSQLDSIQGCADEYVRLLDAVYDDDWLSLEDESEGRVYMKHCAIDHEDRIINFKFKDIHRGLGNYVLMLVVAYDANKDQRFEDFLNDDGWWSEQIALYRRTVLTGFKKEARPIVQNDFPTLSKAEQNHKILERATEATNNQVSLFVDALIAVSPDLNDILPHVGELS